MDISTKIEALRTAREETPAIASVPSAPPKKYQAATESIKKAKAEEFPIKPISNEKKKLTK